jgi:1,2-diacylglycerol 3-beta-galactosyltransferase
MKPNLNPPDPPHILFLFSDTGGGHRSAAEAIIEALDLEFGDSISTEMVDIIKAYAPRPLNRMTSWYPKMVRIPELWGLGYHLTNGRGQTQLITGTTWPYIRRSMRSLVAQHPSDLIVSVHPVSNSPVLKALGRQRPPFITVVTDLVTTHAFWYDRRVDLCIVPTEGARKRALEFGLKSEKVKVVGLPVADHFCQPPGDRLQLREQLGWPQDLPVVLLVGGGEGMGPLEQIAASIDTAQMHASLVVISGRNKRLRARLEARKWSIPTHIYGFVRNMPDFMGASDILVTKAGPGTITEALNAGLPMVLYSRLPGQEDGNVSFVTSQGAGVWAPEPVQVVQALRRWIERPEKRFEAVDSCRRLARPQSAREIARLLASHVGIQHENIIE